MIFESFPLQPAVYSADMRPMVAKTIERYGVEEWRAGVLTNELHGHLGIYAIIGVKMGIYALSRLGIEAGDVSITSLAGNKPPVSCLNDGLQVSTSATFGHGLIVSEATDNPLPEAIFHAGDKSVHIRIKDEILNMIRTEIAGAVKRWGHAPMYWEYVRQLAIRYWYELDRDEIFEEK